MRGQKEKRQERPRLEWKRLILLRGMEKRLYGGRVRETPCVEITYAVTRGDVRHSFTFHIEEGFGTDKTRMVTHLPEHFCPAMHVLLKDAMALSAITKLQGIGDDPVKTLKLWEEMVALAMKAQIQATPAMNSEVALKKVEEPKATVDKAGEALAKEVDDQLKKVDEKVRAAEERSGFTLGDQLRAKGQTLEVGDGDKEQHGTM